MTTLDIKEYLIDKGCEITDRGVDHISTHCFFCNEDPQKAGRLYINVDEGSDKWGLIFCFLCSAKGNVNTLRAHFGDPFVKLDTEYEFAYDPILAAATEHYVQALEQNPQAYEYLTEKRGLTEQTIVQARLGWADGKLSTYLINKGFSPDEIKETGLVTKHGGDYFKNEIIFPYLDHGYPVQLRGKEIGGKTRGMASPLLIPYGIDTTIGEDMIILCEGECFPGEAEVLTESGWVRFSELGEQNVCQVNEEGVGSFVRPLAKVQKHFKGKLVQYSNSQQFYSLTTPGHKMPAWRKDANGDRVWSSRSADEGHSVNYNTERACIIDGPGVDLTYTQIRFMLAVAADFSIVKRSHSKAKSSRYLKAGFVKKRKIKAVIEMLEELGIEYKKAAGKGEKSRYTYIHLSLPDEFSDPEVAFYPDKKLPWNWVKNMSLDQKRFVLREQAFWDGNHVPNRNQVEFSSADPDECILMQALSSTAGYCSTIMSRENKYGSWFKVSILFDKHYSNWQSLSRSKKEIVYDDMVYCVTVPSGMILVRQHGCISVSGNCDQLTLQQFGYPAIGLPGVMTFKNGWEDFFDDAKRIYIMFDNDKAGKAGAEKMANKLGSRCRVVDIPYKGADVNDLLVKKGKNKDDFDYLLHKAKGGLLVSMNEAYDRWLEIEGNKDLTGLKFNVKTLDDAMSIGLLPGQVAVLIAKTGSAKSIMSMNLFQRMRIVDPNVQILYVSLELTRNQVFEAMFRIHQLYFPGALESDFIHHWKDNLLLVDQNRISENDLTESIDQFAYEAGFTPNLICVDYLGYYARGAVGGSEYDQTTNAIMGLKAVAKEMQSVFLVPHQVNRTGNFAAELTADQAKSSGAVENTADWLASQWSMDTQPGIDPEEATGEVFQKILKSRNGGMNTKATYIFDPLSLAVVPIDDHEMASRAYFMRDCHKAGDTWQQAIKRLETGDLSL